MIAGRLISKGAARSVTLASPWVSFSKIPLRVGSLNAKKTDERESLVMPVFNQMVKYESKRKKIHFLKKFWNRSELFNSSAARQRVGVAVVLGVANVLQSAEMILFSNNDRAMTFLSLI